MSARDAMVHAIGQRRVMIISCSQVARIALLRETQNLELFVWIFDEIPGMWRYLNSHFKPIDLVERVVGLAEGEPFSYMSR